MQKKSYDSREELIKEAISCWKENNKIGTLIMATGTGKTYTSIIIACGQLKFKTIEKVIIVVPTTNLITQWKKEILHWGYPLTGIDIKCIQTAYKNEDECDLLIIDEVHTATSPKYSAIFEKIKYKQILGVTATVDPENEVIKKYCPVVFKSTIKDSLDAGAFNDYGVYNIPIPFSKKESAMYRKFNSLFNEAKIELLNLKADKRYKQSLLGFTVFDIAKQYTGLKKDEITPDNKEIVKWAKAFWSAMTMRKQLCYIAPTKIEAAIDLYNQDRSKQWIIFCMNLKVAEALAKNIENSRVFHYKLSQEEKDDIITDYTANKFNCLIAIRALDAGLNVPNISRAISISGDSSQLTAIQRLGRISRKKETKSIFINLFSKNSVDKKWTEKRNEEIDNKQWTTLQHVKTVLKEK